MSSGEPKYAIVKYSWHTRVFEYLTPDGGFSPDKKKAKTYDSLAIAKNIARKRKKTWDLKVAEFSKPMKYHSI